MQLTEQTFFSRLSIILSSLCVIHCLSVPFVIILLPAVAGFFSSTLESIFILSVIPISFFGFYPIWKKHKNHLLMAGYVASLLLMIGTHVGFHALYNGLHFIETLLMFAGAFLLGYVIYKNNKHTHVCKNPHHEHHHD